METPTQDLNTEGTSQDQTCEENSKHSHYEEVLEIKKGDDRKTEEQTNATLADDAIAKQSPENTKEKTDPKPNTEIPPTTDILGDTIENNTKQSATNETERSNTSKKTEKSSKGGFLCFGLRKNKNISSTRQASSSKDDTKERVNKPMEFPHVPFMSYVTLTDVTTASYRIRDEIHMTPCERSERITEISDYDVYFKREYLQVSGSYKTRGAINALLTLSEKHKQFGVMGTSGSSHGLALAVYGKKYGIPVTILIPENVHPRKVTLYDKNGAKTHFAGTDDCEVIKNAHKAKVESGLVYIDENENPYVVSGVGTLLLEIVDQVENIDAIIVPVGGGSLLAAACVVIKSLYPKIQIIGVESEHCPTFKSALQAGHPVTIKTGKGATLADGLSSQRIGQLPFDLAKNLVDKIVSVSENLIALAVLRLLEKEKAIVEGSGAAGLAALMGDYLPELRGKRIVVPLCGGNIDPTVLGRAIERGLTADGRMVRFVVKISDRPGALARLTSLLVSTGVSVKDLYQERTWLNSSIFSIQIKCVAELRNAEHGEELKNVLLRHYKEDVIWNQTMDE